MPEPHDLLEEAKDIIDEITDLPDPLPVLEQLTEYVRTLTGICEALQDAPTEAEQ
jgi:hypothetical protein